MKMMRLGLFLIIILIMAGCAGSGLEMTEAMVDPGKVAPGDETRLQVKVADQEAIVADVTATVREYPEIVLNLNDNGEDGDKIKADGLWSIIIEVPDDTENGIYNWDFKAYDVQGKQIKVTSEEGKEESLKATAPIEITN